MKPPAPERLALTIPEAAAMLGVSRSKGYELARRGIIPVIDLGGAKRVPRRRLEELLERAS